MNAELIVERRTPLPVSPEEAFAWHARPGALERLAPPWRRVEVLRRDDGLTNGGRVRFQVRAGPCTPGFTAVHEHRDVEPGRGFTDIQVSGPFDRWLHTHRFEPGADGRAILHDRILCELPLGIRLGRRVMVRELERLLTYRHAVTRADLAMHRDAGAKSLHVAVTGASGLIGSLLIPVLTTGGHRVTRLVRRAPGAGEIQWDPAGNGIDPGALAGVDAVVHLAGENIATRWTEARKREIMESRRRGTRVLAESLARDRAAGGPRILVSASAIGFYGERGEETLTEGSAPGAGFLPAVSAAWEDATQPAEAAGIRVVPIRIGLLLTPAGGLLERMLPPFRLGVGGPLGSGDQWMSWISADDLLGVFHLALTGEGVHGPLNAVAPAPVRNSEFTEALGRALRRPALLPVPRFALRLLFGDMADEAILASAKVVPEALRKAGYRFRHQALDAALSHLLGTTP